VNTLIRVLIVDDSAFVRKVVREMLASSPYVEVVGTARDGVEGLEQVEQLQPDVVTCDLVMPKLDGVGFVREQMARKPVPILLLSVLTEDGEKALEALSAGAVDFVQKPTALANDELKRIRDELIEKVKAAARAPVHAVTEAPKVKAPEQWKKPEKRKIDLVVIGISTGGPQALRYLLPQFPADFPVPIAMVLHMPVGYTAMFAKKLDEVSQIEVLEAGDGIPLKPGRALLAQAGRHLMVRRTSPDMVVAQLSVQPLDLLHRPAADVLFRSAADVYGGKVLGVVMTGMGRDGQEGAAWVKAQGGSILTESEQTCVIYGMPRSVVEAGLSDAAVPLDQMAKAIMERI
jgi:two-component system, chemotaxis family, protein-glutamate methylesterase/glutaminase